MDILTPIAVFLSPYLAEAGKTVATETVKTLFASRQDLAERFKSLFHDEIITLGLNEATTAEDTVKLLSAKPEVKEEIRQKVENNQDLMELLTKALSKQEGRTISCKTYIEKIEHIENFNA